jgi:RNA polymerase sigma-70 factor, ECF subfamily
MIRTVAGPGVAYATIASGPPPSFPLASFGHRLLEPEAEPVRVEGPADVSDGAPRLGRLEPDRLGDHVGRLYRAAYGLCGSREDAEDLVQETFERVLRRPRFIRRDQDLAYLMRVLRNTWISSGRVRKADSVPLDEEEVAPALRGEDTVVAQVIDGGAVYDALRALTQPLREAVVAVDVVGLSYREASRALGVKEGTIMSRLHRARREVATALQAA